MQGDALNVQAAAATLELCRPVPLPHFLQLGKKRSRLRERAQNAFNLFAKADDRNGPGLVAVETHCLGLPVNVLGGKARNVGLCAAQVPAKLVKSPAFVSVNNDAVETEPRLTPLQRHGCAYAGLAGLGFQRLGSTSLTS